MAGRVVSAPNETSGWDLPRSGSYSPKFDDPTFRVTPYRYQLISVTITKFR